MKTAALFMLVLCTASAPAARPPDASPPAAGVAAPTELRVCADPNNLPYSNRDGTGLENRVVALLARELGLPVRYTWWAQRRGHIRQTLSASHCDVVAGVAASLPMLSTTRPIYRSTYVFLSRTDRRLGISSLDDPRLRELTVGVQLVGDDGANTPPAHSLARRGIVSNVRGYLVWGDYRDDAPQAAIVEAVDRGEVDVALVWGPLAGYFSQRSEHALEWRPVEPWLDGPQWPMVYDVSLGVRREDRALRRALDRAIEARRAEIDALVRDFGVPIAAH